MPKEALGSMRCICKWLFEIQSSKESGSDQSSLCFVPDIKAVPSAIFIGDFQSLVERNPMHAV